MIHRKEGLTKEWQSSRRVLVRSKTDRRGLMLTLSGLTRAASGSCAAISELIASLFIKIKKVHSSLALTNRLWLDQGLVLAISPSTKMEDISS